MRKSIILILLLAGVCYGAGPKNIAVPRRGAMPAIGIDQIKPGNSLMVSPGNYGTHATLQAAYDWLASSDRDAEMGALSATNPRCLILSPGKYGALVCSTNYVNLSGSTGNADDVILTRTSPGDTVEQTCNVMSIADVHIRCDLSSNGVVSYGLHINCTSLDNAGSKYTNLVLGHSKPDRLIPSSTYRYPTFTSCDEKGLWVNCRATNYAWRVAKDMDFSPEMWNCTAGIYSYGGDQENDTTGTGEIGGKFYNCVSGSYGFGGCDSFGMKSNVSSKYYGCIGSVSCFSIGKEFAGTAWNCYALTSSFGGYGSGTYYGTMSGKLYNCTMGDKSAGAGNANCANTGITQGCTITALSTPIYVGSGARIRQSYISVSTVDVDAISIIDDTSPPRIYDTTIEVNSAGTGVPINAGAAQTAFVAHCRMNNRDVDADGLGANVTNLCSNDGQNVVENDI